MDETKIQQIIKDTAYAVNQSIVKENSNLLSDLKINIAILQENHKEVISRLIRMETKLDKTNGKVGSLEQSRIKIWTAISVAVFMVGAVALLYTQNIDAKINSGIVEALSNYEIK